MGINKNKDYCLRYFNAVTLYVSIVMTIASIVGTCVTWFVYMVQPIENAPFYETSGLPDHFVGYKQMSSQLAFDLRSYPSIDPKRIYIDTSQHGAKFYECDADQITIANKQDTTMNRSQYISDAKTFIPFNGIGDFCYDSRNATGTFDMFGLSSRVPFNPPSSDYIWCFTFLNQDTEMTTNVVNDQDFINYLTFNINFPNLCKKIHNGELTLPNPTVIGLSDTDDEQWDFKINYYNYEYRINYNIWLSFAIVFGVIMLTSIGLSIYLCYIHSDVKQVLLFKN